MSYIFTSALETFRDRVTALVSARLLSDGTLKEPEEVAELVEELFRFLTLKVLTMDTDATQLAPSVEVDKAWHEVILSTMLYRELCDAILPPTAPSPRMLDHDAYGLNPDIRYHRTLDMYKATFGGEAPSGKWWPPCYRDRCAKEKRPRINIIVQAMTGKTATLKDIDPSKSVDYLKSIIQSWVGIPPEQQRLVYRDTEMEGERTLMDYGVHETLPIRVSWPAQAAGHSDVSSSSSALAHSTPRGPPYIVLEGFICDGSSCTNRRNNASVR